MNYFVYLASVSTVYDPHAIQTVQYYCSQCSVSVMSSPSVPHTAHSCGTEGGGCVRLHAGLADSAGTLMSDDAVSS